MAARVTLHVGLMKSGTTFIQGLLYANRQRLADRGVLVPGEHWGEQVDAVKDVLRPQEGSGAWSRLTREIAAWPGDAVVSMEFLGPAKPRALQRVVRSLRPARVEVVVSVRDLNRSIVALWQETIQNGRWWTWEEYVAGVRAVRPDSADGPLTEAGRTFWRQQHAARVCAAWAEVADACTLVTVPPPGADRNTLTARFGEAAGFPVEGLVPPTQGNESIGAASTLALRRMNELLAERGLPFPQGSRIRKQVLAKQVMAAQRDAEPRIGLPVEDWVRATAGWMTGELSRSGVRLVGEWGDLEPVAVPGIDPATVPPAAVAEAAAGGLAGLVAFQIGQP
ncbi:MAG TPA: hypothetical protein PLP61_06215 [Nocardioides sp.]|uniref:hypothetical protein n=1 Tax=Nocardioides sp. TaxID=35761 RepID=UPI002BB48487|nr:hypothetical protein [Nocardioides sp.]HQR26619.1 hypothetical protein [Nocardioides sp.]